MRLVIALVAMLAMALAACSNSDDDSPHRSQSGPYNGGSGGGAV